MFNIIVQGIGVLGIVASVVSFQQKKHRWILTYRTINEFLFAIQYFLLGAYTGMAMNFIGCIRNVILAKMVRKNKSTKYLCFMFSIVFVLFTVVTWAGVKSILIAFAKVISTFGYGNKNPMVVRILILITSSCWLVYNITVRSYAGAFCEIFTLLSIAIGMVRIDLLPRICKSKTEEG